MERIDGISHVLASFSADINRSCRLPVTSTNSLQVITPPVALLLSVKDLRVRAR